VRKILYQLLSKRNKLYKFIKFCIVGSLGTIPNYIVFNIIKNIDFNVTMLLIDKYDVSWACGIISGMIFNFILNDRWVFSDDDKNSR